MRAPAIPARKAAIPKAASFTPATFTPAAAAARSLARTASICSPSRLWRSRITAAQASASITSTNSPKAGVGISSPFMGKPEVGPNSTPNSDGSSKDRLGLPSMRNQPSPRNSSSSMARALARVAMASDAPRTRSAGSASSSPKAVAASAASSGASGKGMPASVPKEASPAAATPVKASWASDIWPTYPVTTTRLRARMAPIMELVMPVR